MQKRRDISVQVDKLDAPVYLHGVDYDPTDKTSILEYAQQLQGTTLRKKLGLAPDEKLKRAGKGALGETVEEYWFGYKPNSIQGADFPEAGVELKVTPVKRLRNNALVPKERLSVTMIDYMTVTEERFETSTLESKLSDILFMFYEYEPDRDPLDFFFRLVEEWQVPEEDRATIRSDWQTIIDKIRAGKAHELSSGDTMYLEASTKSSNASVRRSQPFSDIGAKPRAFALKQSYMKTVLERGLNAQALQRDGTERNTDLKSLVLNRFKPYIGLSCEQIAGEFGISQTDKGFYNRLTRSILGITGEKTKIVEFEKADISLRSVRLKRNGMPPESISFPCFDYCELAEMDWEDSDFYAQLTRPFLFVLYQMGGGTEDGRTSVNLKDIRFWTMPADDLDEARRCFEDTKSCIRKGDYASFPRLTTNRCCHVRPHGRNASDVVLTPQGTYECKKCFWLNANYIGEQLANH